MDIHIPINTSSRSIRQFSKLNHEIELAVVNSISVDYQEYDFDKSSFKLKMNFYLNEKEELQNCLLFIANKVNDKGACVKINFDAQKHDIDILYPISLLVIKLFSKDSFRHQRHITLLIINNIYTEFSKRDKKHVFYSFWGGINDLENIEDYMVYIYKQLKLTPPNFNEFVV